MTSNLTLHFSFGGDTFRIMGGQQQLTSLEICAGAGGQVLGLGSAGFAYEAAVELYEHAAQTLVLNRPHWNVVHADVRIL